MEIKFSGTGGAFDVDYGNSSALVKVNGKKVLLDCGHAVFPILKKKGLIEDFDFILITHFHDDHVGSLSALILYRNMIAPEKKLSILYPDENFKEQLIRFLEFSIRNPLDYVNFQSLSSHEDISFIDTYGKHVPEMNTYAYYFEEGNKIMAYSGDLGDGNALFQYFQNYSSNKEITFFHEVTFEDNIPPHTYYKKLEKYKELGDIFGYHCDASKKPGDLKFPLVAETPELLI